jgi:MerR family mercuric resistance operon transcriptional regulator
MHNLSKTLTIGVLAEAAGVNVETIRFYQRKGLMQEPDRPLGGIRRYGDSDLARVRFIKSAQRLGFSLEEIAQLLKLEDGSHCTEAREQAEHKLADVRARLADLQRIEGALQNLVERCCATSGQVQCPLIAALQETSVDQSVVFCSRSSVHERKKTTTRRQEISG